MSAPLLRRGDKGPAVADWQRTLVELGYKLIIDGDFGPLTDAATRAFQGSRGLVVDGIVGPKTRAAAAGKSSPPRVVEKVATPLSEEGLRNALARGHELHFGAPPSTERLACAWAHVAHDNGRGRAVWCWNLGNITAFGGWSGSYYVIRVQERVQKDPDVWKEVDMRFRAHATAEDGARDYWAVMTRSYGEVLELFDQGKPYDAAIRLGSKGFYTAHAEPYARGVESLYRHFVATLRGPVTS